MSELQKDESVLTLITKLKSELGEDSFQIIDHWECDLCAVGLAHPDNEGVLVYISTWDLPQNRYYVSLELPSTDKERIYQPAGDFKNVDFEALVRIISEHFSGL